MNEITYINSHFFKDLHQRGTTSGFLNVTTSCNVNFCKFWNTYCICSQSFSVVQYIPGIDNCTNNLMLSLIILCDFRTRSGSTPQQKIGARRTRIRNVFGFSSKLWRLHPKWRRLGWRITFLYSCNFLYSFIY